MKSTLKKSIFLLVMMVALLAAGSALAGKEVTKDGLLHIANGAEPSKGTEIMSFKEVWRVGGEDSEDFFGLITQVLIGDDGNVYLLDTRLSEVPVYSADGERINTLSREGDGPGETRTPTNLITMPDGNLGLVQMFPGKITMIDHEGGPQGIFEVGGGDPTQGGFVLFYDCFSGGGQLIVSGEDIKQNPPTGQIRTNFVASYDAEGKEKTRFLANDNVMDFTKFAFDEDALDRVDFRKACAGPDGRVYVAPIRNSYEIHVFNADGTMDRIITREYEHRARLEKDYNAVKATVEAQLAQLPNASIKVSKTEPDLGGLQIGPDGNLWVTSSRSGFEQPEGILATYDVFSLDGHFIKQVSAKCEGEGLEDNLFFTPDGGAVLVTGFTEAVRSLQAGGAGTGSEGDEEAKPMEVIYFNKG